MSTFSRAFFPYLFTRLTSGLLSFIFVSLATTICYAQGQQTQKQTAPVLEKGNFNLTYNPQKGELVGTADLLFSSIDSQSVLLTPWNLKTAKLAKQDDQGNVISDDLIFQHKEELLEFVPQTQSDESNRHFRATVSLKPLRLENNTAEFEMHIPPAVLGKLQLNLPSDYLANISPNIATLPIEKAETDVPSQQSQQYLLGGHETVLLKIFPANTTQQEPLVLSELDHYLVQSDKILYTKELFFGKMVGQKKLLLRLDPTVAIIGINSPDRKPVAWTYLENSQQVVSDQLMPEVSWALVDISDISSLRISSSIDQSPYHFSPGRLVCQNTILDTSFTEIVPDKSIEITSVTDDKREWDQEEGRYYSYHSRLEPSVSTTVMSRLKPERATLHTGTTIQLKGHRLKGVVDSFLEPNQGVGSLTALVPKSWKIDYIERFSENQWQDISWHTESVQNNQQQRIALRLDRKVYDLGCQFRIALSYKGNGQSLLSKKDLSPWQWENPGEGKAYLALYANNGQHLSTTGGAQLDEEAIDSLYSLFTAPQDQIDSTLYFLANDLSSDFQAQYTQEVGTFETTIDTSVEITQYTLDYTATLTFQNIEGAPREITLVTNDQRRMKDIQWPEDNQRGPRITPQEVIDPSQKKWAISFDQGIHSGTTLILRWKEEKLPKHQITYLNIANSREQQGSYELLAKGLENYEVKAKGLQAINPTNTTAPFVFLNEKYSYESNEKHELELLYKEKEGLKYQGILWNYQATLLGRSEDWLLERRLLIEPFQSGNLTLEFPATEEIVSLRLENGDLPDTHSRAQDGSHIYTFLQNDDHTATVISISKVPFSYLNQQDGWTLQNPLKNFNLLTQSHAVYLEKELGQTYTFSQLFDDQASPLACQVVPTNENLEMLFQEYDIPTRDYLLLEQFKTTTSLAPTLIAQKKPQGYWPSILLALLLTLGFAYYLKIHLSTDNVPS
ncbi:MAG: hypothetical protein MPJ24_07110 [Pirellulaceae bacterium]|nr:hypothetical protein [Pirellulaceae bacterium]